MKYLIILVATLMTTALAYASPITYYYTGNNYDIITDETPPAGTTFNTSQHVTGSLTFASPLADGALGGVTPTAFSFSNGVHTFTQLDSLVYSGISLYVAGGAITQWDIRLYDQSLSVGDPLGKQQNALFTRNTASIEQDSGRLLQITSSCCYQLDAGTVNNAPGTWRATTVPEPATLALVGIGLLGLGFSRRRKRA